VLFSAVDFIDAKKQGKLFSELQVYLRRSSSNPPYLDLNFQKPRAKNPLIINKTATAGQHLINSWCSQQIPLNVTLEKNYNFIFGMYGQLKYGQVTFYGELYIVEGSTEKFVCVTSESGLLNVNVSIFVWQHQINYTDPILEGSRVIFKLYFNATTDFAAAFLCDSKLTPSFISDPEETRFYRSDSWTDAPVMNKILTSSSGVEGSAVKTITTYNEGCMVGVKIYVNTTVISGSSPVALVNYSNGDVKVQKNNNWTLPQEYNASYRYVKFEVWCFLANSWSMLSNGDFRTEVLVPNLQNYDVYLNQTKWKFYYICDYSARSFPTPRSQLTFYFDGSSYNSKVTNFTYYQKPKPSMKQWNNIAEWTIELLTRQWNLINQWNLYLYTRQWQTINIWILNLYIPSWKNISFWTLNIGPETNIAILFIALCFLGIVLLLIFLKFH